MVFVRIAVSLLTVRALSNKIKMNNSALSWFIHRQGNAATACMEKALEAFHVPGPYADEVKTQVDPELWANKSWPAVLARNSPRRVLPDILAHVTTCGTYSESERKKVVRRLLLLSASVQPASKSTMSTTLLRTEKQEVLAATMPVRAASVAGPAAVQEAGPVVPCDMLSRMTLDGSGHGNGTTPPPRAVAAAFSNYDDGIGSGSGSGSGEEYLDEEGRDDADVRNGGAGGGSGGSVRDQDEKSDYDGANVSDGDGDGGGGDGNGTEKGTNAPPRRRTSNKTLTNGGGNNSNGPGKVSTASPRRRIRSSRKNNSSTTRKKNTNNSTTSTTIAPPGQESQPQNVAPVGTRKSTRRRAQSTKYTT